LAHSISEKSLAVQISKTDTNSEVICDAFRIGQIFQNLLTNAIKFTPEGKSITIEFSEYTTSSTNTRYLETSVTDQGIGIPETELDTVFDKFTQSSTTNTGAGGTGLGLAICQQIIEGHQGHIRASNSKEGGAVFLFRLPYPVEE